MAEYTVVQVWDQDGMPGELDRMPIKGIGVAWSRGRIVTTVTVETETIPEAISAAFAHTSPWMVPGAKVTGVAVEPTSATPHFMLAAFGR
jgi:hypothetical protein